MAYTFDQANAKAPSKRETQYFELVANRGIYHDGWIANTTPFAPPWDLATGKLPDVVDGYKWELYNITEDFSQYNNLAEKMPDKLKEMQALFATEAAKYNVFPLDNTAFSRLQTPRPSAVAGKTVFTYTGENSGIPLGNAPDILDKDYTITAEVTIPEGGAEGMIVTLGGRFGGYGLYLLKGKPVFVYNLLDLERFRWEGGVGAEDWLGSGLKPGKHTLVFDFKYDGLGIGTLAFNNMSGLGRPGTGTLIVDGKAVQTIVMDHTLPMILQWDESFDVGSDTLTGVNDADYTPPFALTAKLNKLTIKIDRPQLSPDEIKKLEAAMTQKAQAD
jgi:arylsulfatase